MSDTVKPYTREARYCTEFSGDILDEPFAKVELVKGARIVARQDSHDVVALIGRDEFTALRADRERLEDVEREVRQTMATFPPFYAYGDNEAACWMSDKLSKIASHFVEEESTRSGQKVSE